MLRSAVTFSNNLSYGSITCIQNDLARHQLAMGHAASSVPAHLGTKIRFQTYSTNLIVWIQCLCTRYVTASALRRRAAVRSLLPALALSDVVCGDIWHKSVYVSMTYVLLCLIG